MTLTDIPLMALLKGKMGYISQRQAVIAQNVANADTPGFAPRDLKPFEFALGGEGGLTPPSAGVGQGVAGPSVGPVTEVRTNAMHLATEAAPTTTFDPQSSLDSEVRLDGNHVVLEEQMVKLSAARMDYDAAVGFYQQSMNLIKTALKKPGS